ncbi:site-specific integrase [Streptomyces sp. NPDC001663]|uniref:site-specific integrase n=1 Tax=Streptomyces sp. NPDC001663 TaxID=3364597 RepID=UPI003683DD4E
MNVSRERRRGPVPLVMTGPLAPYEPLLRTELTSLGYAAASVTDAVRMMRRLSTWMDRREITAAGLTPPRAEEFLVFRRAVCHSESVPRRSLGAVVKVLRNADVVPVPAAPADDEVHELLTDYAAYLHGERGLAGESVRCYCSQARKFLTALPAPLEESLARLDAARVTAFMVRHTAESESVWSAKALVTAVRSLLRYLHVDGRIPAPLTGAVPAVAGWRLDSLPRGLASQQVTALLAAPDPRTGTGRRDRAVLTVLARLGLRGAEVAALQMADIDWHAGEVAVRGKGSRVERLPLTAEAGEVLADYITGARPRCSATAVFVTSRAPYQALDASCIRAIMGRACARAGLPRLGAHRLRHTLATTILRAGAPLPEVGQVLRHRSQLSTTVYAKVDHAALRTLAQPWPEGGGR